MREKKKKKGGKKGVILRNNRIDFLKSGVSKERE